MATDQKPKNSILRVFTPPVLLQNENWLIKDNRVDEYSSADQTLGIRPVGLRRGHLTMV